MDSVLRLGRSARGLAVAIFLGVVLAGLAYGADAEKRLFDREKLQVSTGTATINSATADYSKWQPLVTIAPDGQHALQDVEVVLDLNQATTGFGAVYTSGTITASFARKVDGTNWRIANNQATATVSGTTAGSSAGGLSLDLGPVLANPTEGIAVYVKISSVSNTNVTVPYVVYYRAGARATVTPAQ